MIGIGEMSMRDYVFQTKHEYPDQKQYAKFIQVKLSRRDTLVYYIKIVVNYFVRYNFKYCW